MAVIYPAFRKKFPILVSSGLLALQPFASPVASASEQFDCHASASGGWACAAKPSTTDLPRRPQSSSPTASFSAAAVEDGSSEVASSSPSQPTGPLVTQTKGRALAARSADYSHLDWVPREKLSAAQLAEAGPYCAGMYVEPARPGMNDQTPLDESPMFVSAQVSRYQQEQQIATLAGDVVLRQAGMQVEADEANLLQAENRGELVGNVRLRDRGMLVVGDRAELQLDNGEAKVENAEFVIHQSHARGSALYAKRDENAIIRLKDGTYTRCEPGDNDWHLKGNNITLNPETGFGHATNVTLRVKNIPVFYTPYIYFPIDDRRQSGFLAPSISSSSSTGFSVKTPYYFNLAPNYDATLYPTLMADRGLLMEGEFRYLTESSEGKVGAAFLNDQDDKRKLQSEYEKQRWMVNLQNTTGLDSRWLAEIDYSDISDPYYFQDLDTDLDMDQPVFLNQRGSLTYRGDSFTARADLHAYKPTSVIDTTPYDRMPQLSLDGQLPFNPAGLEFGYATEYSNFRRSLRNGDFVNEDGIRQPWYDNFVQGINRAEGDRVYLETGAKLPLEWAWGYVKPSLRYSYTRYDLDLDSKGRTDLLNANQRFNSSPNRSIPIYSVDSGLYFDRNTTWGERSMRQTLEPRLFYLYVPYENQRDIPVFDTSENTFNFASLWRDNRFAGRDRIGDENKLSLGVTSRWIEENGFERQRVSLGQAFYFRDRKVQMPGVDYRLRKESRSDVSPYALEYLYRFNRDWTLRSDFNWDPDQHRTRSGSAMFHYQPESDPRKVVNFGYRYRNDSMRYDQASGTWRQDADFGTPGTANYVKDYYKISQHDFSIIWPIVSQWSVLARWQHDYSQNRTLEALGGVEYDNCCWKLRVVNRYWIDYDEYDLNPSVNEKGDRGIFLQIVFKGLGNVVGSQVDSFLSEGIRGYREREDQSF